MSPSRPITKGDRARAIHRALVAAVDKVRITPGQRAHIVHQTNAYRRLRDNPQRQAIAERIQEAAQRAGSQRAD